MRILIVKLTSFGDVIHTFPAITDLKTAHPSVEIDWLVEEALCAVCSASPGNRYDPHIRISKTAVESG